MYLRGDYESIREPNCNSMVCTFKNISKVAIRVYLSLIFLLINNLINKLRLHQFLGTKTTEKNKSLKTDANVAH